MVTPANRMTKAERSDLLALIKKREKVMKVMASERSAEMIAEFEAQAAQIYSFNDDTVWEQAERDAQEAADEANRLIQDRCKKLGIPREFAPGVNIEWHGRGQNAFIWRMTELRRVAKKRIEAFEAEAHSRIERMSLDAQTELLAHGLDTDAAQSFLETAKSDMAAWMPSLSVPEIEKMTKPMRQQPTLTVLH